MKKIIRALYGVEKFRRSRCARVTIDTIDPEGPEFFYEKNIPRAIRILSEHRALGVIALTCVCVLRLTLEKGVIRASGSYEEIKKKSKLSSASHRSELPEVPRVTYRSREISFFARCKLSHPARLGFFSLFRYTILADRLPFLALFLPQTFLIRSLRAREVWSKFFPRSVWSKLKLSYKFVCRQHFFFNFCKFFGNLSYAEDCSSTRLNSIYL